MTVTKTDGNAALARAASLASSRVARCIMQVLFVVLVWSNAAIAHPFPSDQVFIAQDARAGDQDLVYLQVTVEPQVVYPLQAFTVRLQLDVRGVPEEPFDRRDPLELTPRLPDLLLPWVDDDQLPKGLEPRQSWDRWLGSYTATRGPTRVAARTVAGVSINGLERKSSTWDRFFSTDPFEDGRERRLSQRDQRVAFHPAPERILLPNARGQKVEYWRYRFDRSFSASQIGEYSFGPATIKGPFPARIDTRGRPEHEFVVASAGPVEITVREPPLADRPPSYMGAIGHFRCGAELVPTSARVGDPLTLTIWLQGRGTFDQAVAPRLDDVPDVAGNFRVYEPTEETVGDQRRFIFSLRPLTRDLHEFPPIPLSYFDVDRERYVTLQTAAIPLAIAPAERLSEDEIAIAAGAQRASSETGTPRLLANMADVETLRNETADLRPWLAAIVAMATLFLLAWGGRVVLRRRGTSGRSTRLQQAVERARDALESSRDHATDARSLAQGISHALVGLVADVSGVSGSVLTSDDAAGRLESMGGHPELVQRFRRLLDACDAARFGDTVDAQTLVETADSLLRDLASWLLT